MTIYDIAEKAGVSASTVSRVINDKPGVGEKTRRKIRKLLEEYHYTPDIAARGLVMQSSRIIGILIEDIRVSHHTDAIYRIEQDMSEHGYTCITLSTGAEPEKKQAYIRILEQRKVEGVIMIGSMFGEDSLKEEILQHLADTPVVLVNGDMDLPNVYCVIADEERGTEECVSYLVRKGYRQISYMKDAESPSNNRKLSGYRTGILKNGLKEQIFQAPGKDTNPQDSVNRGYAAAQEILNLYPGTDAILCGTDMLGVGCMHYLREAGREIPGDIAVMGVDNTIFGKIVTPTLSTLDNKLEESCQNAVRILLEAIDGRSSSRKVILPTEIIGRESTAVSS